MSSVLQKVAAPAAPFDVAKIRADFPILSLKVHGKPLAYLDNAASAQMPQPVLDRLVQYQTREHANIHRAVHYLSETATAAYEGARKKIQRFINAREEREVIYTRGTTDAVNLVMHGYGRAFLKEGDEIIVSHAGASLQHRALADAVRREGLQAARDPVQRRRRAAAGRIPEAVQRAHQAGGGHPRLQRAGHGQPGQGDDRNSPTARVCRFCSTARRPCRT